MKNQDYSDETVYQKAARYLICLLLCACAGFAASGPLSLMAAETEAYAGTKSEDSMGEAVVTFSELNDDEVFLKQSQAHVCTLTSSTMMIRRAAMLSGNQEWKKITEASVRKTAWLEGTGLRWNFTSFGITVAQKSLSSGNELIGLLDQHPEGIVIYNTRQPHAILVTDYTDGVFYCSDPVNNAPSGRYPVSMASITIESASRCWYVKNPVNLAVIRDDLDYKVDNLVYEILDPEEKTAVCTGMVKDNAKVVIPDSVELDGEEYQVVSIASDAFAKSKKLKKITIGANVTSIGSNAFYQCKKLKSVTFHTPVLEEIGTDAFARIHKDAQILILAEEQMETFAQLLTGTNVPQTVSIGICQVTDGEV